MEEEGACAGLYLIVKIKLKRRCPTGLNTGRTATLSIHIYTDDIIFYQHVKEVCHSCHM